MSILFTVLHVVGAVFIVGPMAILPQSGMRAIRSGNAGAVRTLAKSTNIFTLLSIIVAVLGFGVVGMSSAKDHFTMGTPWILISVIAYVIALGLSLFLVVPALRAAAEGMANADFATAPLRVRVAIGSGVSSLLLLLVVVLMVWKP